MKKLRFIQHFQSAWKSFWASDTVHAVLTITVFILFVVAIIWLPHSEVLRKTDITQHTYSSANISITIKATCHWSCDYDPYVTFLNNNDRKVTIVIVRETTESGVSVQTKINMFIIEPKQKIRKYVGNNNLQQLHRIEAIIESDQGTAENIVLWD